MSKKIEVRYFAMLREQAGIESEILSHEFVTPSDLYLFLQKKYDFKIEKKNLKVAINECYENFDYKIKDGDIIVFIPPVAGG